MKKLLLVIATVATTLGTWALFLASMCLIANEPQCMFGCALLMMGFDAAAKYFKVHDDRIATEPRGSLGTTRVSECSEAELGRPSS